MRMCNRNRTELWYSLYKAEDITYLKDENGNVVFEDIDGELVPIETGHKPPIYLPPVKFRGYLQFKGGESEARAFGVSIDSYTHILIMRKGEIPIDETSVIYKSETATDPDFIVTNVAESLNFVTYLLRARDANNQD